MIGDFDLDAVNKALRDRGIKFDHPCPMCGEADWSIASDGFFQVRSHQTDVGEEGMNIATVLVLCGRCGFISAHSAAVLGLVISDLPD